MRFLSIVLILLLLFARCKPPRENFIIQQIDSLLAQTDSLNRLISSMKMDSLEKLIQIRLTELNEEWVNIQEDELLQEHLPSINQYRAIYFDFDSCMLSCVDFFDEIHTLQYELSRIRELYFEGELSDSLTRLTIQREKEIWQGLMLRLTEKMKIISYYRDQVNESNSRLNALMEIMGTPPKDLD